MQKNTGEGKVTISYKCEKGKAPLEGNRWAPVNEVYSDCNVQKDVPQINPCCTYMGIRYKKYDGSYTETFRE